MTRVDFYHLQKQTLEQVLPKLLEKAYSTGKNIKIKVGNEMRVEFINSHLWTFDDTSFIPHGSKKDGFAELQPIWLSSDNDNPNLAALLFWSTEPPSAQMMPALMNVFSIFSTAILKLRLNNPAVCGKNLKLPEWKLITGNRKKTEDGFKKPRTTASRRRVGRNKRPAFHH